LLLSKGSDPNLCYVGLRGMGRVGKTPLAQNAYNIMRSNNTFKASLSFCLQWGKSP